MVRLSGRGKTRKREQLEHENAVLRAIRNVNQLIVREKDPDALIQRTCELLVETRQYHSSWIALFDVDGRVGSIAQCGHGNKFQLMSERLRHGEMPACAQAALASHGLHVILDPSVECMSCTFFSGRAGRSTMTARLAYEEKEYGLIGVSVPAGLVQSDQELRLFEEVAADVGFALHAIEEETLRGRAVEGLERERRLIGLLLDMSPTAIVVVDAGGAIVQANGEAERVLGLRRDDIAQRTYNDPAWHIVDYEGNPFPDEQLPVRRVLKERRAVYGVEHAIEWPTGERVLLSINAAPVRSGEEKITRVVCSMLDVTAQKRMEAALRESESRYRSLFEQSMDASMVITPDGTVLQVNEAFLKLTGYERGDIPALRATALYADPFEREDFVSKFLATGSVRDEVRFKRKDGSVFECERSVVALEDASGAVVALQGIIRDISERKRAEAALRDSEARYRSLFEQSMDATMVVTLDGTFVQVNEAFLQLTGYEPGDIPALKAVSLYADPSEREDFVKRILAMGFVRDEVRFKKKDGSVFDCERSVVVRRDENGNVVAVQGVHRDITARKLAEKEIRALAAFPSENPNPVLRVDGNRVIVFANKASVPVLRSWGVGAGDRVPAEWQARLKVAGEGKSDVRVDVACGERVVEMIVAPLKDKGEFNLYGLDVTEARVAERTLRASEERFRAVFESSPTGIAIVDTFDQRFVMANRTYLSIVGYAEDELKRLTVGDITVDEDWVEEQTVIRDRLEGMSDGYLVEKRYVRKDGSIRDVLVAGEVLHLDSSTPPLAIASVIDITDRKQAQKELAESRELLRQLTQRVEAVREEERTTIALELHDRVGQTLTALSLDIGRAKKRLGTLEPDVAALLDGMEELVESGADDVRRISSELRPGALDDLGLAGAISWQMDEVSARTALTCRVDVESSEDIGLAPDRSTALFRVFQELVTNVVRHASATSVYVKLVCEGENCVLTVTDDGRGVDVATLDRWQSLGVAGMKERLRPYGGQLHYESIPGSGTTARVIMPLE